MKEGEGGGRLEGGEARWPKAKSSSFWDSAQKSEANRGERERQFSCKRAQGPQLFRSSPI